jgi:predicted MPP superfamily phosphohydrolase
MKFTLMLLGWMAADIIWWRLADRAVLRARWAMLWRILLGLFTAAQLVYLVVFLLMGHLAPDTDWGWPLPLAVVAYVWHILVVPGTLILVWAWKAIGWARRRRAAGELGTPPELAPAPETIVARVDAPRPARLTRREALAAFSVAVPPLAAVVMTARAVDQLGTYRVRDLDLRLPTLPADLDGLTIAHVTDLHIGRFMPAGVMERVATETNALAADLVVYTGDLLDGSCTTLAPGVDFIRRLDPRHGLVMIEGNHDQFRGADRFEDGMRAAGLPLLLDEARTFRVPGRSTPVQLLGASWGALKFGREMDRGGRDANLRFRDPTPDAMSASVATLAGRREAGAFPILLAHHPHLFDPAAAAGLPLVLAGHTHGGQLMLSENVGVGPLRFRYWTGLYSRGDARLFVNNGVGNWFPLRINAPAEIVKITLRRG